MTRQQRNLQSFLKVRNVDVEPIYSAQSKEEKINYVKQVIDNWHECWLDSPSEELSNDINNLIELLNEFIDSES